VIGYSTLGTDDPDKAFAFYDPLLELVGAKRLMELGEADGRFTLYGTDWGSPALALTRPFNGQPQQPGNGNMIALVVDSRDKVDALHAKALELGGSDEGAPGLRGDPAMNFYAGYFRDPEGHKLAAFTTARED
jgi:catechol 2,3-dioxygenase-like lactoylglutathione lyase family enzyme